MTLTNAYTIEIKNRLSELTHVTDRLMTICEEQNMNAGTSFHLQLACDELITNTISYGYEDEDERTIRISVTFSGEEVALVIEDDGRPFDPFGSRGTPDLTLDVEEREIGGLGIHLVTRIMEQVAYERAGRYNITRLTTKRNKNSEGTP
ncbi:ATP-binding protein [Paenibacillus sp. MBLB4367]|uniref:ATP-binding protein n=1 Tax=Paenibacillus sp. MBLB4367 TaxID=3384767 RepID=UPI0039081F63